MEFPGLSQFRARLRAISRAELRDAARLALQSAAAAAGAFIAMRWLGLGEIFVAILSAVLIVQPSADGTLGAAWERFFATILGSVIGVVGLLILPYGYGTVAALVVSMAVLNAIASFRSDWRYGVVAAVAISLGSEQEALSVALDRSIGIAVGIAVGIAATLILWPETAQKRYRRHRSAALHHLADQLHATFDGIVGKSKESQRAREKFLESLQNARDAAESGRLRDDQGALDIVDGIDRLGTHIRFLDFALEDEVVLDEEREGRHEVERFQKDLVSYLHTLADGEIPDPVDKPDWSAPLDDGDPGTDDTRRVLHVALAEICRTLDDLSDAMRKHGTKGALRVPF